MTEQPLSPGDHFFQADGVRFHYLVRGNGPLIVVQSVGWGLTASYIWNSMGPDLEKKNTALYFEPRGNGNSSKPEDPDTMTAKTMAEDLEHLRKHIGLDVLPVLMGGTHAGAIALRYAERYPSHVAKLVLFATQIMDGPPNTNTQDWIKKRQNDPAYAAAVAKLFELVGGAAPTTDEEFGQALDVLLPWYFSDPTKAEDLRKAMDGDKPSIYAFQTNLNDTKPENKLPHVGEADKVEAKTLIIIGAEDAMCSLEASTAVSKGIRNAKLVVVPGAGHCPWIERPATFWQALHNFLNS